MEKKLIIKKCLKCGAVIKVINDCNCPNCDIVCCTEKMTEIRPNTTDAAIEKHLPVYEKEGNKIKVTVPHVMEEEHYIEWICLKTKEKEEFVSLKPNENAVAVFENVESGLLYAYCNKHGLWMTEIEK